MQRGQKSKVVIISLGGSIIAPEEGKINSQFLKGFRKMVLKLVKLNFKFVIVVGGGKVARLYQKAASETVSLTDQEKDWLGIFATILNANLVRTIFKEKAFERVLTNPHTKIKTRRPIMVAAGWKPGCSTDYDTLLWAVKFKAPQIIEASNIPFVYNEDPKIAKLHGRKVYPLREISWEDYRKMIGSKWSPGLTAPVDPVAAKEAQKRKIKAVIVKGTDLTNLEKVILGKPFEGTRII